MNQIVEIPLQKLTHDDFRPFGQIVAAPHSPATWSRPGLDAWTLDFGIEGEAEVKVVRYHYRNPAVGQEFEIMERHTMVTETRIPLMGSKAVLVVSPPTPIGCGDTRPIVNSTRAFHLDGTKGVMLWKGTWHALDCYPLVAPGADFVFITERETEAEVEKLSDMRLARRTEITDIGRSHGVRIKIADPNGVA